MEHRVRQLASRVASEPNASTMLIPRLQDAKRGFVVTIAMTRRRVWRAPPMGSARPFKVDESMFEILVWLRSCAL